MILSSYECAGAAVRLFLQVCAGRRREGRLKVENGVVFFGVNSGAANDFYIEAKDAGFEVIKGASQSGCYENSDEFFKLTKSWFVRLVPV